MNMPYVCKDIGNVKVCFMSSVERSGKTISDVCIAFGVSRETWYKWKRRYDAYGIDGLKDQSIIRFNISSDRKVLAPHVGLRCLLNAY
jgi:hypothetical protein